MDQQRDLLSLSDFFVVLIRMRWVFLSTFLVVVLLAAFYALKAKKTYELTGTVCVGKFQGNLLEEGEFVVQKLADYSFIKRAMDRSGVQLDISVMRMQKLIKTEVVNEVKKTKDVGLVQLNVRYKDQQKVVDIFKALTDQLVAEHQVLLDQAVGVLRDQERQYRELQSKIAESATQDEQETRAPVHGKPNATVPEILLLEHTLSEKRAFQSMLTKDIHEVRVEAESATESYNTKLAAQPATPDAHLKPKLTLTMILGVILATMAGLAMAFLYHLWVEEIRPKLNQSD